jgi:Pyridoxamine 5'-phosphate oxidase
MVVTASRPYVIAEVIATDAAADATPIDWDEAGRLFAAERSYWVATTSDDGRPHVRPVLAVWIDERIYSTTSPAARKGRNLTSRPSAALTAQTPTMDIVIEGPIAWIDDPQRLRRVGEAYQDKYSWPVTVAGNGFNAPYAAPTAGHAPYRVYELTPTVAYAFGTDNNLGERSTRYRFSA